MAEKKPIPLEEIEEEGKIRNRLLTEEFVERTYRWDYKIVVISIGPEDGIIHQLLLKKQTPDNTTEIIWDIEVWGNFIGITKWRIDRGIKRRVFELVARWDYSPIEPGFEVEIPWFAKPKDLFEAIMNEGVKETIYHILSSLAEWPDVVQGVE
jgi:hypothetical protein